MRPRVSVAIAFICQLASGSSSAVGSFDRPDGLITPSTRSSAASGTSRTSGDHGLDALAEVGQRLLTEVQAVQQAHVVAAHQQPRHQDAADVAGAAGHEDRLAGARGLGREAIAPPHGR
jgi:hypothetical protein